MLNVKNLIIGAIAATIVGCTSLSSGYQIQADYFRLENFKSDKAVQQEYVYLMCAHKKPVGWDEARQYPAGEHNFWIKASLSLKGTSKPNKEAYFNFKLTLDNGGDYILNREIKGDNISVWVQDIKTGAAVSEIQTKMLHIGRFSEQKLTRDRCKAGTA